MVIGENFVEKKKCRFCSTMQKTPCSGTHDALACPVIESRQTKQTDKDGKQWYTVKAKDEI